MKIILTFLLTLTFSFSAYVQEDIWWKGESLLTFLDKNHIPKDIYFSLSKTDKELCSEIYAGVKYQVLYDEKNHLSQALIPISEEMQIHIFKDLNGQYKIDIIPIEFQTITQTIAIDIQNSPYLDIVKTTGNKALANEFIVAFKKTVNFRRLRKGDKVSIKFIQKIRSGRYFGTPKILGAMVRIRGRDHFIFQNPENDRYYDDGAKSLTNVRFKVPLRYKRISSKFTYKRWHPILHRYRAHLGMDFAAPSGRKVWATADGKIIFKGRKGGYGKVVMIRHKNGYKSLYAHLSRFNNKLHVGSWVKQGDYIARVGTTGRSTGPHLHFGIYKNGRAVNPAKLFNSTKVKLAGKKRKKYIRFVKKVKKELLKSIKKNNKPMKLEKFDNICKIEKG